MKFLALLGLVMSTHSFAIENRVLVNPRILDGPSISESSKPDVVTLTKDNTLILNAEVTAESVAKVMVEARKLDSITSYILRKPIYLFLNTPGGSISAGLELIDYLNGLKRGVNTITMFAASMGFQIAQNLNERLILPHGTLMSHRARGGIEGEFGGVSPNQLESRYKFYSQIMEDLDNQTVKRTKGKQTLSSYEQSYVPELWLTADKAINGGYADRVVTARCDESLTGVDMHEASFMGLSIAYATDKCPLNSGVLSMEVQLKTNKGLMDTETFKKQGGSYSSECLILAATDRSRLCSMDTTLNNDKITQVKASFVQSFNTATGFKYKE